MLKFSLQYKVKLPMKCSPLALWAYYWHKSNKSETKSLAHKIYRIQDP